MSGLPPLASIADVADIEGAPTDQARLTIAGEAIRSSCDWHIAPAVEMTMTVSGTGGPILILPSLRVLSVASVRDLLLDEPITDYRIVGGGRLVRAEGALPPYVGYIGCGGWPRGLHNIEVTFTHGHDVIPEDLKGALIGFAESVGEVPVGIRGESHQTGQRVDSVTYFAEGTYQGGSGMPPAIEAVLSRYRVA